MRMGNGKCLAALSIARLGQRPAGSAARKKRSKREPRGTRAVGGACMHARDSARWASILSEMERHVDTAVLWGGSATVGRMLALRVSFAFQPSTRAS